MKVNKLWDQDAVTMGDLQETVDKLEALQVKAIGRKVRSPRPMESCYVTYQPTEGLYKVSFGSAGPNGYRSNNHSIVYEYPLGSAQFHPKDFLKCEYDNRIYPEVTSGGPCGHIQAVLNYRESTSN